MTLPLSGPISFNNINVELGVSGTTQASLGQTSYRNLAGVASGAISMSNFYGKANQFAFTISSNQTNANLRTLAVTAGWNQSSKVVATIGSGVYISSNSTGTPALTINGSFPGGIELINNGFIMGMGGWGGGINQTPVVQPGGVAISLGVNCSIQNNSYIAGGGGGGAGTSGSFGNYIAGGGGAGGGAGGASGVAGGAGGAIGSAGGNGGSSGTFGGSGGGGGRILPGVGGNGVRAGGQALGGLGGGAGGSGASYNASVASGSGGSANNAGGTGATTTGFNGGGGGGWGAVGGNSYRVGALGSVGAAGGNSVQLNGYSVTWTATGNRWGNIS